MKWFEIITDEEAKALRHYYLNTEGLLLRPKIGDRVTPSAGCATVTDWPDYPEADRLTFDECMAIVRDEVTVEVMKELGGVTMKSNVTEVLIAENNYCIASLVSMDHDRKYLSIRDLQGDLACFPLSNLTATKLRILVAILKGEKI